MQGLVTGYSRFSLVEDMMDSDGNVSSTGFRV